MFEVQTGDFTDKSARYADLLSQLDGLVGDDRDGLANLANASALLAQLLPDLNWVGFYLLRDGALRLGPFQGRVACVHIALGKGVCGTAAAERRPVVVPDVRAFAGHIACDAASRAEIVVPLLAGDRLLGVLDVDSPRLGRFDDADAHGLTQVAQLLTSRSDWSRLVS